eukprot:TRINITY_DN4425_c0_g1_i1.p1 TRINITY_DN4425_c0_g1~~TRINITY_DN4425_c0_g1_i1.p1  ORF type:complete len:599 (+),score=148.42 TRINITY_DN4425_c0_g1_i1:85-1881(+)
MLNRFSTTLRVRANVSQRFAICQVSAYQKRFYSNKPNVPSSVVFMPALSPTMESGKLVSWHKKEGDRVEIGDAIGDVQTDKATLTFDANEEGYIAKILIPAETENVKIETPIAIIVQNKDDIPLFKDYVPSASPSAPVAAATSSQSAPESQPTATAAPVQSTQLDSSVPFYFMPALSPTMESGKIARWVKNEGDAVAVGEAIIEVETDKAVVAAESLDDYYLAKILVPAGSSAVVGTPIGILVSSKDDIEKYKNYTLTQSAPAAPKPVAATPSPAQASEASKNVSEPVSTLSGKGTVAASPLARKIAAEKGVPLQNLVGTGPGGRIIRADVEEYSASATTASVAATSAAPRVAATASTSAAPSFASYEDIPNSNIRKITAERLTYSKQSVPHYYLTIDINVDNLMKLRTQLSELSPGLKLSVNDFIVKAAGLALKAVPQVNSEWRGDCIRQYKDIHINVAVNTPKGLLTPVVRDVDKIGLKSINQSVKELATRANEGKSTPSDLQPGTFTISNLGMFGISSFSAVINPPQAAILAVGAARKVAQLKEPKSVDEAPQLVNVNMLSVTLSCDHRVVDGAVGAQWLQVFKDLLENPIKFLY